MIKLLERQMKKKSLKKDKIHYTGVELLRDTAYELFVTLAHIFFILLVCVFPFFSTNGYAKIGTDKCTFFIRTSLYILVPSAIFYVFYLLFKFIREGKEGIPLKTIALKELKRFNLLDMFVFLYAIAQIVSYAFSVYKDTAFWGAKQWYMGLVPQLFFCLMYFVLSNIDLKKHDWLSKILFLSFPVSFVVFLLGILNRYGVYPIDMKYTNTLFLSTVGNIDWYTGYLFPVTIVATGIFIFKDLNRIIKTLLGFFLFTAYTAVLSQGSAGVLLSTGIGMIVLFLLSVKEKSHAVNYFVSTFVFGLSACFIFFIRKGLKVESTYYSSESDLLTLTAVPFVVVFVSLVFLAVLLINKDFKAGFLKLLKRIVIVFLIIIPVAYIGITVINTKNPGKIKALEGNPYFVFDEKWGTGRGVTYKAGALCLKEYDLKEMLVGVGPDSIVDYISGNPENGAAETVRKRYYGTVLTNVHCEPFNALLNLGLFGLISYAGMFAFSIKEAFSFEKALYKKVFGAVLVAYLVNALFSFQNVIGMTVLFMILALMRNEGRFKEEF